MQEQQSNNAVSLGELVKSFKAAVAKPPRLAPVKVFAFDRVGESITSVRMTQKDGLITLDEVARWQLPKPQPTVKNILDMLPSLMPMPVKVFDSSWPQSARSRADILPGLPSGLVQTPNPNSAITITQKLVISLSVGNPLAAVTGKEPRKKRKPSRAVRRALASKKRAKVIELAKERERRRGK